MIFITAGTQLPFDRLVEVIDEIASQHKDTTFVIQALNSKFEARHVKVIDFISAAQFDHYVEESQLIISHAGMGTIITALVKKKPIIVMPRLLKYKEHRNEHQLGTCKQMDKLGYVHVAYDEQELKTMFNQMWPDELTIRNSITADASNKMISTLNHFIKF